MIAARIRVSASACRSLAMVDVLADIGIGHVLVQVRASGVDLGEDALRPVERRSRACLFGFGQARVVDEHVLLASRQRVDRLGVQPGLLDQCQEVRGEHAHPPGGPGPKGAIAMTAPPMIDPGRP